MTDKNSKPILLSAVETVLADPKEVRQRAFDTLTKCRDKVGPTTSDPELKRLASQKIVSRYSNKAAVVGGATALVGIVPGLGTIIGATGGAMSDAALCMKFQLEMTWELATIYGRDIDVEEEKNLCLLLAGFGAFNEIAKQGGTRLGVAALANMSRPYLRGAATKALQLLFKRLGLMFARKAFEKAIPFGVGFGISVVTNKAITHYVGKEVSNFFLKQAEAKPSDEATTGSKAGFTRGDGDYIDAEFTNVQ